MDDLFKPIKSTRKVQSNIDRFETLSLRDTSASRPNSGKPKVSILDLSSEVDDNASDEFSLRPSIDSSNSSVSIKSSHQTHKRHASTAFHQKSYLDNTAPASLPNDAREILKSQPDQDDLSAVLQYLQYGIEGKHDFNIRLPSPKASQIVNVLVTVTIPDQWTHLEDGQLTKIQAQIKRSLIACLRSVAGLGALLMQIRQHSVSKPGAANPLLTDAVSVLSSVLSGTTVLKDFLSDAVRLFDNDTRRRVFWQEVTSLFAGSRIFSTLSQAFATIHKHVPRKDKVSWLADGREYSKWLARNIAMAAIDSSSTSAADTLRMDMLCQVSKRGLSLGYRDALVIELYSSLLLGDRALWTVMHTLLQGLSAYDQKSFFDAILRDLARRYLRIHVDVQEKEVLLANTSTVGGVAAMISGLVQSNTVLRAHLTRWLTATDGEYAGLGLDTRRAVMATVSQDQDQLQTILGKSLEKFGDKLRIQHDPILQQESIAQSILLALGHLERCNREAVKQTSSSGLFLGVVSNRLSASVPRARFLGMLVAVALSRMVDKPGQIMNFGVEEMEGEEAERWLDLPTLQDHVGDSSDLRKERPSAHKPARTLTKSPRQRRIPPDSQPTGAKIIAIEELPDSDDSASEDEDDPSLRPYARPDSDPSDSEEDPTLINRNKPAAPVYITSLVKQLNTTDDPDVVELALKTAPALIRRKANFGDELSSNLLPLASSLLNLQDGMSKQDMHQLRVDALIACLVSRPSVMGPWAASTYFEGDFSLSQRALLLTVVGLGSREIAGIDDELNTAIPPAAVESAFPSKRLPPRLESNYSTGDFLINTLSTKLSHQTLRPLALSAADELTGPDILKVRTFSSRMAVAAKESAKVEARSKRIPKDLHKVLAESIYLPICSRLILLISALPTSPHLTHSTLVHPSLLRLSLQTLIVIVSTLGPNAMQLPTVTRETLLLLTAVHTSPSVAHDPIVLPAILHLLLTILDLNVEAGSTAEERLVTDFGPMIAELVSWAADLGTRVSIPEVHADEGLGMGMPWTILVAGIQVKWQEVGRKFQGRMLGLMASTDFDKF
ncbi:telomere length regulation protein-domain-containing protein [Exophiala viscosa]|uniref:Telomere length regulation protein-domain-containing protein n=1 Tax=Exophiala viscosa TaxID=2486360 RepID=A0AAN6E5Y9_9EURO|nr:telomere length regulation protein-domain-containing protein [Exophiala viscosa]KAI1627611.1 telomere length regulation protein-domain-containing protein [Exophiala viscosa]